MAEFGCFYNPRPSPGRCIKDTLSSVVEGKCEIESNRCRLKDTTETKPIIVPTVASAKKIGSDVSVKTLLSNYISNDKTNSKLSGPVSAYSGTLNGQKILLFGDSHFSMENMCKTPCKMLQVNGDNIGNINPEGSAACWELDRLFSDIFIDNEKRNQWVDFYLEIPFLPKGEYKPTRRDIKKTVEAAGGLYNVFHVFYNCFDKYQCKFDKVRFHYSDVRLEYRQAQKDEIMTLMETMIGHVSPSFDISSATLQGYVMDRMEKSIGLLLQMIQTQNKNRNKYIESTDKIIKGLYYSGGQTMTGRVKPLAEQLFKLYLVSDKYVSESEQLLNSLLDSLDDSKTSRELLLSVLMPKVIVNRHGKTMHRSRAQLEGLENEGKEELSNKIKKYLLEKYVKEVDNSLLVSLWSKFMQMYQRFINPRSGQIGVNQSSLMELKGEYDNFSRLLGLSVSSTSLLMDGYILGRMFRSFPQKNHIDSKVKIIYAGAAHIDTYLDFFTQVMNVPFYSYGQSLDDLLRKKEPNRCIDINIERFLN